MVPGENSRVAGEPFTHSALLTAQGVQVTTIDLLTSIDAGGGELM